MTLEERLGAGVQLAVADQEMRERLRTLERANRDKDDLLARERDLRTQLEEAHVAKDRLLAVLAHDLRTPINAILGWTELLRREQLDHHTRDRALATIEHNARAQQRLLDELLDISRVSAGDVQLEREPVDLAELVQRCADALAPAARDRGLELRCSRSPEALVVAGDRRRLQQITTKLLSNALDATPRGGRVAVTAARDGLAARITVEDTGRGISREVLPHLFEPSRVEAGAASVAAGVGLSLYIVRRSVEMHSGSVFAESEGAGKGARFTVTLPAVAASQRGRPSEPPSAAPPSRDGASRGVLAGARVLVVDDEEDARELLAAMLRHRGANVTAAADVTTALAAFDACPVDVVVSDLGMPGRSGFDLARELRARPNATTLIAVSGFASPDEVERAYGAGFDVHLAKPIEPAELIALIRDATTSPRTGPSRAVGSQNT